MIKYIYYEAKTVEDVKKSNDSFVWSNMGCGDYDYLDVKIWYWEFGSAVYTWQ